MIVEGVPQHGQGQGVLRGSSEAEFLVSIRHGLLPLRLGDRIILEPYMPHRCAHQFGLDQDIPAMIYSSSAISADLEGFARCWATFLRTGTGSRFLMPKTARVATFTAFYCRWFHDLVQQCQSHPPPYLVSITCPARGDPTRRRSVPALQRAPDFQGFYSLLPPFQVEGSTSSRCTSTSFLLFFACFHT